MGTIDHDEPGLNDQKPGGRTYKKHRKRADIRECSHSYRILCNGGLVLEECDIHLGLHTARIGKIDDGGMVDVYAEMGWTRFSSPYIRGVRDIQPLFDDCVPVFIKIDLIRTRCVKGM